MAIDEIGLSIHSRRLNEIGFTPISLLAMLDEAEKIIDEEYLAYYDKEQRIQEIYIGKFWDFQGDEWFWDDLSGELSQLGVYFRSGEGDASDIYFGRVVK